VKPWQAPGGHLSLESGTWMLETVVSLHSTTRRRHPVSFGGVISSSLPIHTPLHSGGFAVDGVEMSWYGDT